MAKKTLGKWQIRIFILCWIAYASIYLGRVNLTIAIPFIQEQFSWNKVQIGVISTVFFWIYGIGQLINGHLGDRISSRKMIFTGLLFAGLANIVFGFSGAVFVMVIIWGINGYFQSMLWGPVIKSISNWYPAQKRGRASVRVSTSIVAGYMIAWGLSGRLGILAGWRWIFWVPGIFMILYSFIMLIFFRNKPEDVSLPSIYETEDNKNNPVTTKTFFYILFKEKLWIIVGICFLHGIIREGMSIWGPLFLIETWEESISLITGIITIIPLINFGGIMLSAWLYKKFKYNEKLSLAVLFLICILSILCLVVLKNTGIIAAVILLGIITGSMFGATTILLGIIPVNYAKYNKSSSIAGFMDFCTYLAAGISTFLTGLIVERYSWSGMLLLWLIIAIIGIILVFYSIFEGRRQMA